MAFDSISLEQIVPVNLRSRIRCIDPLTFAALVNGRERGHGTALIPVDARVPPGKPSRPACATKPPRSAGFPAPAAAATCRGSGQSCPQRNLTPTRSGSSTPPPTPALPSSRRPPSKRCTRVEAQACRHLRQLVITVRDIVAFTAVTSNARRGPGGAPACQPTHVS
jgi:hypothetical protein